MFVSTIQLEKTARDVRIFTTTPPGSLEERVQQTSAEVTQIDINGSLFNVLFKKKIVGNIIKNIFRFLANTQMSF